MIDSTLSKVEAEAAKAKAYRFIRKRVEALHSIIKQEKRAIEWPQIYKMEPYCAIEAREEARVAIQVRTRARCRA